MDLLGFYLAFGLMFAALAPAAFGRWIGRIRNAARSVAPATPPDGSPRRETFAPSDGRDTF